MESLALKTNGFNEEGSEMAKRAFIAEASKKSFIKF